MHICYHLNMQEIVVIDTSVLISALIGRSGPSRQVLRRGFEGDYIPLISNPLFQEYEAVTARKSIQDKTPLSNQEIRELLNAWYNCCRWVSVYYLWRPNLPDEGDNFLFELAVAGNAQSIVTNNTRDFSSELVFPDIAIQTPEQYLRGAH